MSQNYTHLFKTREIIDKYDSNKIRQYIDLILEYNQKVNIVSRETSVDDLLRIAADCLVPFEYIKPLSGKFFDIGPGGGFPSIILLLAFPSLSGTLIERTGKKAVFLNEVINRFGLDASVINRDFIEASGKLTPGSFDGAVMKLVRPEERIFRKIASLIGKNGRFIYYGSPKNIDFKLPARFSALSYDYYLDDTERLRSITIFS